MEKVMVSEFTERNTAVNAARDAGGDVADAMKGYRRIVFVINDMSAFMRAIYSPGMDMSGFMEIALEKGREHRIHFFAAVTPDDYADMARYAAMRIWAGWGQGVHLGGLFDAVVHNDAELFELMEKVMVSEFTERNTAVNAARDAGGGVADAMKGYRRIVFVINDMSAFMRAVYSPDRDMSGFMEIALEKGREHRIHFFAAVTPDDYADMARYAAMRIWAGWGRGVHLGGMFDQQSILRFEMSAADSVRQLPSGVGYAAGEDGKAVKIITPIVKELAGKGEGTL
jgi:hypothetical protein